jgi:hypothetical protein
MNGVLVIVIAMAVLAGLVVANDPRAARWLASVIFARAMAVEASREMYGIARRAGLEMGKKVETE